MPGLFRRVLSPVALLAQDVAALWALEHRLVSWRVADRAQRRCARGQCCSWRPGLVRRHRALGEATHAPAHTRTPAHPRIRSPPTQTNISKKEKCF